MKKLFFYLLIVILVSACNSIKHVAKNKQLLTKNTIIIDGEKETNNPAYDYIIQRPNAKALGLPLSLYFYNLGNPKGAKTPKEWGLSHPKTYRFFKSLFSEKQSIGVAKSFIGINNWFLKNGQAPVIIDDEKTKKTIANLTTYYQTEGYFKAKISAKKDTISKQKGAIKYFVSRGKPLFLNHIHKKIEAPILDSLYNNHLQKSHLKPGIQYKDIHFINEANRLTKLFRNNGIYHFDMNAISFNDIDTTTANYKTDVFLKINNRVLGKTGNYYTKPYKIQTIKNINVYTDYSYKSRNESYKDSINYKGINYFAHQKLKYNPKYLSQSIFIHPKEIYTDSLKKLTRTHLQGLRNFKITSLKYKELNDDELEANIYLSPIEKYTLGFQTELSRSNIRNFDVSGEISFLNRNTFKGAELFKIAVSGSYFNSNNGPGWEIGTDVSLEVPRFMAPFGLNKLVPKEMFPRTKFYGGMSLQKNIALDRQNINIGIDYKWQFNSKKTIQLELLNAQYIRNLNIDNYFNIYNSEYIKLNNIAKVFYNNPNYTLQIPNEALSFMALVTLNEDFSNTNPTEYQDNLNILSRYYIISSDFLIPVIAYNFTYNNQEDFRDQDFSFFRIRIANSGNIMGLLSNKTDIIGQKKIFEIPLAQYFKTDIEYKKFWQTSNTSVLGFRAFLGAIFPYENSDIPFTKSYFAGGSNDIRAWKTYDLGPGTRQQGLEYNVGSLKFLSTLEYRFDLIGNLKSALFIDVGNIWDITNNTFVDDTTKFKGFSSIKDLAVGTGFGIRYDFKFLVARIDLGFKVHEPYLPNNKWFKNLNFSNSVFNIGINYPF